MDTEIKGNGTPPPLGLLRAEFYSQSLSYLYQHWSQNHVMPHWTKDVIHLVQQGLR